MEGLLRLRVVRHRRLRHGRLEYLVGLAKSPHTCTISYHSKLHIKRVARCAPVAAGLSLSAIGRSTCLSAVKSNATKLFRPVEQVPLASSPIVRARRCIDHIVEGVSCHLASASPLPISRSTIFLRCKATFDQATHRLRQREPLGSALRPLHDRRSQHRRWPKADWRIEMAASFRWRFHWLAGLWRWKGWFHSPAPARMRNNRERPHLFLRFRAGTRSLRKAHTSFRYNIVNLIRPSSIWPRANRSRAIRSNSVRYFCR